MIVSPPEWPNSTVMLVGDATILPPMTNTASDINNAMWMASDIEKPYTAARLGQRNRRPAQVS